MRFPHLRPPIALFGFIAAFPSVLHEWFFLILLVCDLPCGMINICTSMYWPSQGVGTLHGRQAVFLYWIWSGVVQGCPRSGSLFVLAIDPFLDRLDCVIQSRGIGKFGACADDIGVALAQLESLLPLRDILMWPARVLASL